MSLKKTLYSLIILIDFASLIILLACSENDNSLTSPNKTDKGTTISYSSAKLTASSSAGFNYSSSISNLNSFSSSSNNTLIDPRDGQKYKIVTIGTQTWMAQNLNFETTNSYCYNDDISNCSKYGRLYTWAAAMDSIGKWSQNSKGCGFTTECTPTYPVQGACPTGWHLPMRTEFETLITAVGGYTLAGKTLKSTTNRNNCNEKNIDGSDAYGLTIQLAGYRDSYHNSVEEGCYTRFWTSTESLKASSTYMYLTYKNQIGFSNDLKYYGFSIRCIKD